MISLTCLILPRLEAYYLDEWVEHYVGLGVDKIYIYDNGLQSRDVNTWNCKPGHMQQMVKRSSVWGKKPSADYFKDHGDKQIYDMLRALSVKYKDIVEIKEWHQDYNYRDANGKKHVSQVEALIDAYKCNKSDYWLNFDPDEFLVLKKHDSLKAFFAEYSDYGVFLLSQRVFDKRNRQKVREIYNWGYESNKITKWMAKSPISKFDVHHVKSSSKTLRVPAKTAIFHHYRGPAGESGGSWHKKYMNVPFDKIDHTMDKYILSEDDKSKK